MPASGPRRPDSPAPRHPVARDEELELEVTGLGDGPDGVAKVGPAGYVVFVPGTLPGERVRARITSAARKFARGDLIDVLRAAPERVEPACRHALVCGGCHLQHLAYAAQLGAKRDRLQRAVDFGLGRDGGGSGPGRNVVVAPVVPASPPYGQRHKVALHLRNAGPRLEACFHRLRSPDLVAVRECPASDPLAWDVANAAVDALQDLPHAAWDPDRDPDGLLRSVLARATTTGEVHLIVVATEPFVPGLRRVLEPMHEAGATTISVNMNRDEPARLLGPRTTVVSGPARIEERFAVDGVAAADEVTWLLSPDVFFQTSPQAAAQLVAGVLGWLDPRSGDTVVDLYCGVGLFALPLARRARRVLGLELSGAAVDDARAAAVHNGLADTASFRAGPVERQLARMRAAPGDVDLAVVDPPRAGLSDAVVRWLAGARPRRLAYVSCDPRSLQRDLAALSSAGFGLRSLTPVDMFPQTSHVEALACFECT